MGLYTADLVYVRDITNHKELREAEKLYKEELGILMKQGLFATDKVTNRLHLVEVQEILTTIKNRFRTINSIKR